MALDPKNPRIGSRINPDISPPGRFVAAAVNLAMVASAQRNNELVADLAKNDEVHC